MDESGANASRNGVGKVFASRGTRNVHTITSNEREWISVLTSINANGETIPNYYIFKGMRSARDYLALCENGAIFGMQKRNWVDAYHFSKWMDHFVNILKGRSLLSTTSRHLLVLDGHKAHLTLEVVQKAKTNGIDMLTLPSHTSYGLQPLDIACFKPFKVAFRAYKNAWCKRNPGVKVRKEDLASWVSLGLKKALTPTNIKVGFRGTGIWPINLEAMNSKMGPSESFLPRSSAEVAQDVEIEAEIIEEGLPPPPTNPTHFYVDNEEEEHQEEHQEELSQEDAPTHNHISTCLRLPQENQPRQRVACEPIVDYSQSQILTNDSHVENLQSIAQRKKELCIERERKK